MAVVKRDCIHCGATFDSRNSRGVYCSAACKSQHHRIRKVTERRIVVGRLEVVFRDVNPSTTQEMLEQMVHDALTPEILKIIRDNNEQPPQTGESLC